MFKKNRMVWIVLAITIALAVYFFAVKSAPSGANHAADKVNKTQNTSTNAALTVNTVNITRTSLHQTIPANGSIAPWQEAIVGAEVNGLLLNEVLVNVGDKVKRGQVLARFASGTITADLAQSTASLAEAKAAAIEAAGNASRAKSIQHTGALSTQQIDQFLSTEASTKARVEAAEATLNLHRIKLNQTTVIAPDDGIVSSRTATVGAVATAGQELFRLVRKGRLEWRAELTSADINKILVGMPADLTLPDGQKIVGQVRAIAPSIDNQTRNGLVYVDIPAQTAKAGMYAKGVFILENTEAYTLPADAIVLRDGFSYVMQIVRKSNLKNDNAQASQQITQIKQIKVETGRRSGALVELLDSENLAIQNLLNQQFVASGGAFLADGDTVRVVASPQNTLTESVAQ